MLIFFFQFAEFGVDYSSDTLEFTISDCSNGITCLALNANIGLTGIPDTLLEDMEGVELTLNSSMGNFVGFESIAFPMATQVTITDDDGRLMSGESRGRRERQISIASSQLINHQIIPIGGAAWS